MKTAYKNLISWISDDKDLSNNDYEIAVTSIKLTDKQKNTLKNLLDCKKEYESGFCIGSGSPAPIKSKIYFTEPTENAKSSAPSDNYVTVPLGTRSNDSVEFFSNLTKESLDCISFDPDFKIIDSSNDLAYLIKDGLKRIHGSPENIYHIEDFFKPFIEKNSKQIIKYLKDMNDLTHKFEKFFMEIKLPCWVDWWIQDDDGNLLEPWNDPKYDANGCWCNFNYDLLMEALNLLVKGEEVFFETISP